MASMGGKKVRRVRRNNGQSVFLLHDVLAGSSNSKISSATRSNWLKYGHNMYTTSELGIPSSYLTDVRMSSGPWVSAMGTFLCWSQWGDGNGGRSLALLERKCNDAIDNTISERHSINVTRVETTGPLSRVHVAPMYGI